MHNSQVVQVQAHHKFSKWHGFPILHEEVTIGGAEVPIAQTKPGTPFSAEVPIVSVSDFESGETVRVPLGTIVGARAGDKGGHANLGVFARDDRSYPWLRGFLTTEKLRELLPEVADLDITRDEFPRLRAVHFFIRNLLDEGVSSTLRLDAQAKGLGEWLRARVVDVPKDLLD